MKNKILLIFIILFSIKVDAQLYDMQSNIIQLNNQKPCLIIFKNMWTCYDCFKTLDSVLKNEFPEIKTICIFKTDLKPKIIRNNYMQLLNLIKCDYYYYEESTDYKDDLFLKKFKTKKTPALLYLSDSNKEYFIDYEKLNTENNLYQKYVSMIKEVIYK